MSRTYRIGQIVPSSNTTMETEIPAMLRARETVQAERFTFHSSRMRMKNVTKEELAAMDSDSDRCALELSDARVDVLGYACLVAIMAMGRGYHRVSEQRLRARAPVDAAALDVHCLASIARYKRPKAYRFVDLLPKNNYGKVLKTELRAQEAAREDFE